LPGSWTWQENRYAWRPGFWAEGQPGNQLVPAHYQWTPRGYVYIDGYWDYSVERRGVLFSPVYFQPSVYGRRGFSYSPSLAINLAGFMNHLFLRPSYGHYYFGDYYGANYSTYGFYPWFAYGTSGYGYDPFYARQRWHHRRDNGWADRMESDFHRRRDHEEARPPRTWRVQRELIASGRSNDPDLVVAQPYDEVLKAQESRTRFQAVNEAERQRLAQQNRDVQVFREQRQKIETDAGAAQPDQVRRPARVKLPRSPVVARPADQLGPDHVVPQRHQAPEPDLKVEPKPRQPRGESGARGRSQRESGGNSPGGSQNKPQGDSQQQPQGGSQGRSGKKSKG